MIFSYLPDIHDLRLIGDFSTILWFLISTLFMIFRPYLYSWPPPLFVIMPLFRNFDIAWFIITLFIIPWFVKSIIPWIMISFIPDSWSSPSPDSWSPPLSGSLSPSFASHDHDFLHLILQDLHVSMSLLPTGLQRHVVYLCWPIAPPVYESKCGGSCGVSANEYSCAHHVTWSTNKLWGSISIFNLCFYHLIPSICHRLIHDHPVVSCIMISVIRWFMISVIRWFMISTIPWFLNSTITCFLIFSLHCFLIYIVPGYLIVSISFFMISGILLVFDLRLPMISPIPWFMISTILWLVIFTLIHDFGNTLIHHDAIQYHDHET